ncbi:TetR family transcriptional regulator [Alloalcanivorax dieselolei B5]|uniref:TetR family transcriptional regulator n=1 Tax=Alcanivorax dieselolei (strain DSM 16502 / CGMCC 1.3690 / MCCC 1A00001 / B-5) TaxID=930169 RepID=K0CAK6_ALCDB|nr:TetR family transcriptional regulator [Alloalcanivorax dieselolei]AFT69540.1 TetR family transcriptional regulator [Alloalcanivorax dieselolei B5]GGK04409.1 TetR family transcriptional regulator [Alloalcanivorax dieselolei]
MAKRPGHCISTRKEPKQARAEQLLQSVLEAAVQVLAREGAARFTTARVAERAGVSVGSLYQYFPNKAAILFRLQLDEWRASARMLEEILSEPQPPLTRLRHLVQAFIASECAEAEVRQALADAAPLYRDAPEAKEARQDTDRLFDDFMLELLPGLEEPERDLASELIASTMTTVGKAFSGKPRTDDEITRYAGAMADMLCSYIEGLNRGGSN